jgi:hypothetical protein
VQPTIAEIAARAEEIRRQELAKTLRRIRHDDAEREFAYDRHSHIGKLDRALDDAGPRGWTVVSMRRDWKQVYPNR